MFIQTESTPNPATLKFLPGQSVLEVGTADFPSADTAAASPLARRIFGVDGVTGVFLGTDFVTVTKADGVEWDHVKPAILGAVMEHFQSGAPAIEGYPVDNQGAKVDLTMAYVGTRGLFEKAGFTKAADTSSVLAGFPRVLMRLSLD